MKKNSNLELSLHDFNADNPTPRIPVVICLDTSSSMDGEKIIELNKALKLFYDAIYLNDDARYSAEICVISSSDKVNVESGFKLVEQAIELKLEAKGSSSLADAIVKGLDLLEERKDIYKKSGTPYYQPWVVVMSASNIKDVDNFKTVISKCNKLELDGKIVVFPIGVGEEANYQILNKFSTRQRAFKISHTKFDLFFKWLSQGISVVSSSQTGDTINIPVATISTWGGI